jgi:hypothetical protein
MSSSYYPTQEDELRAKEAEAETVKQTEEAKFLSTFQTIPVRNVGKLSEMAEAIVRNFNRIMEEARQDPYQRQEEQINVIDARRAYTIKINPSTALKEEKKA